MNAFIAKVVGVLLLVAVTFSLVWAYHSTQAVQIGAPGVGMEQVEKNDRLAQKVEDNKLPVSLPPASQDGQLAIDAYKNVQVLGHITSGEMTRLMTHMTIWVAPKQGCAYCHAPLLDAAGKVVKDSDGNGQADPNRLWSDELYTKVVARRMLQMTMHINSDWKKHVQETGVTCWTCHRGNPVPTNIWFKQAEDPMASHMLGSHAEQNSPARVTGLTSLPYTALETFLDSDESIRMQSTEPLPIDNRLSIKQTEYTYGLMMHLSTALGVNCTYCHNSRSLGRWESSPPARTTAWYGIRMVRELNKAYLDPLATTFPENRLGPTGDGPKVNCATCHNGAYKPLLGASMLKENMVLAEAKPQPQKSAPPPPPDLIGPPGSAAPVQEAPAPAGTPASGAAPPSGVAPGAPDPAAQKVPPPTPATAATAAPAQAPTQAPAPAASQVPGTAPAQAPAPDAHP